MTYVLILWVLTNPTAITIYPGSFNNPTICEQQLHDIQIRVHGSVDGMCIVDRSTERKEKVAAQ